MNDSHTLIADAYRTHNPELIRFFVRYVQNVATAEDLSQDVFLRLAEWRQEIKRETVRSLVFKIARNLLNDYLRRVYVKKQYDSHVAESNILYDTSMESSIIAADLFRMECRIVAGLSRQRRTAYILSRFEGKSAADIAEIMGLSRRTAENHIFIGKKEVKESLKKCC